MTRIGQCGFVGLLVAVMQITCGCATGLYDSVLDGMNRIIDVHASSLLQETSVYTPQKVAAPLPPTVSQSRQLPVSSLTDKSGAYLANTSNTPLTISRPQYIVAENKSHRVTPQTSLPEDPMCRELETLLWQQYKNFEYDALLINAQFLIESYAATNRQRAMAYILMGSVFSIRGKTEKAEAAFANAIKYDPTVAPTETIFPSSAYELYQKTKSATDNL